MSYGKFRDNIVIKIKCCGVVCLATPQIWYAKINKSILIDLQFPPQSFHEFVNLNIKVNITNDLKFTGDYSVV